MSFLLRRIMATTRPHRRPASPKARLWLRALEDRLVPATFTVTNTSDTGTGSGTSGDLRYCITQANATAGPNTIDATGINGTITLTAALPAITQGLTITGPGASLLTINANHIASVFNVDSAGSFTVSNVTLTGGSTTGNGGAIDAETPGDNVTVTNSVISGNTAANSGGGIFSSQGALTITNTTVSSNSAGAGGAGGGGGGILFFGPYQPLVISNSTIADNTGPTGGGICLIGFSPPPPRITNSTITGNTAQGPGGGIYYYQLHRMPYHDPIGSLDLDNTIVSGNNSSTGGPDINSTVPIGASYSALGTTTGFAFYGENNLTGANASPAALGLGPLTNFVVRGTSPAQTMPLIPLNAGSTAVGAGDPGQAGTLDERGAYRPPVPGVTIGAFEGVAGVPTAVAFTHTVASLTEPAAYEFTVTYADDVAMLYSSISSNANAVSVTANLTAGGSVAPTVTFIGATPAGNAGTITATYEFTAPGGAWTWADNGTYTVSVATNQIENTNDVFVPAGPVGAFQVEVPQILVVTNTNDSGPGSLRAAITAANADASVPLPDMITFANSIAGGATNFFDGTQHTISLLSALPTLADPVTIQGPGSALLTVTRGSGSFRIFDVNAGLYQTVNISGLTVSGGNAGTGAGIQDNLSSLTLTGLAVANNTSTSDGAGIYVYTKNVLTTVNIVDCQITNNSTFAVGGGLYCFDGSNATAINIAGSTFSGDAAAAGGGIFVYNDHSLTVTNSTLTGDVAVAGTSGAAAVDPLSNGSGGALFAFNCEGGITVTASTITGNTAGSGINGYYGGGGIAVQNEVPAGLHLDNTIVSGNSNIGGRPDISVQTNTAVESSYSAIGSTNGFIYTPGPGDLPVGTNLHLQSLASNGGPTQTIAFSAGSPLLNAGNPVLANTTDQRGVPRNIGPAPDIGAYEYQPIAVANVEINDGSAQRSEVRSITVAFSGPVSFANGNAAAAFQLQHVQDATNINNLSAAVSANSAGDTVVTLTFTTTNNAEAEIDPVSAENGGMASLADGRYQLTVLASDVSDAALGWALDGDANGVPGGNYVSPTDTRGGGPGQLRLYRLFGDADGDGIVDQVDVGQFRSTFNANSTNPNFLSYLDADNSGVVDQVDLGQFRSRFNTNVFAPSGPGVTPPPPTVAAIEVNDGSAERSEVRSVTVTFSGPVLFAGGNADAAAAFHLDHLTDSNDVALAAAVSTDGQGQTVVTLTFSGAETDPLSSENGGMASLADGRYTLTVLSANVTGANGLTLNGGGADGNYVSPTDTLGGGPGELHLFRLFGDVNGDGIVDQTDLGLFRSSFDAGIGNPLYQSYLDADNSGVVDALDLGQFRSRFNTTVF